MIRCHNKCMCEHVLYSITWIYTCMTLPLDIYIEAHVASNSQGFIQFIVTVATCLKLCLTLNNYYKAKPKMSVNYNVSTVRHCIAQQKTSTNGAIHQSFSNLHASLNVSPMKHTTNSSKFYSPNFCERLIRQSFSLVKLLRYTIKS